MRHDILRLYGVGLALCNGLGYICCVAIANNGGVASERVLGSCFVFSDGGWLERNVQKAKKTN